MNRKINLLIFAVLFLTAGKLLSQDLYFCEEYRNGREINVSDVFSISPGGGYLTVMYKSDYRIGVSKVDLEIYKLVGGRERFIETLPFDIDPDWDYIHFDEITFHDSGYYRVVLVDRRGYTLASGYIEITY